MAVEWKDLPALQDLLVHRLTSKSPEALRLAGRAVPKNEGSQFRDRQDFRPSISIQIRHGYLHTNTGVLVDQMRLEANLARLANQPKPVPNTGAAEGSTSPFGPCAHIRFPTTMSGSPSPSRSAIARACGWLKATPYFPSSARVPMMSCLTNVGLPFFTDCSNHARPTRGHRLQ